MSDEFATWVKRYARLFGLTTPQQVDMLLAWVDEVFIRQGFAAAELEEATTWILAHHSPLPRFPTEHLDALLSQLRAARKDAAEEKRYQAERTFEERLQRDMAAGRLPCQQPAQRFRRN